MAWQNDGYGIPAVSGAHSAHRSGVSDLPGDLSVTARLAERDCRQCLPDFFLKLSACAVELQRKFFAFAREVFVQLALRFEKHRMLFALRQRAEADALRIIVLPQNCSEPTVAGHQLQSA